MIIARDVAIAAGARPLLSGASFSLQAGDKIGLVGRNGAGKTTLLRTLSGVQPARRIRRKARSLATVLSDTSPRRLRSPLWRMSGSPPSRGFSWPER